MARCRTLLQVQCRKAVASQSEIASCSCVDARACLQQQFNTCSTAGCTAGCCTVQRREAGFVICDDGGACPQQRLDTPLQAARCRIVQRRAAILVRYVHISLVQQQGPDAWPAAALHRMVKWPAAHFITRVHISVELAQLRNFRCIAPLCCRHKPTCQQRLHAC